MSLSVPPLSVLRCTPQIYTVQIDNSILGKVCDILMNGWRGSAVASCVNRRPWFLRGGFAVVLRVSLGRAVMARWLCSCAVVAPGLFCGRPASALFLFGDSAAVALVGGSSVVALCCFFCGCWGR